MGRFFKHLFITLAALIAGAALFFVVILAAAAAFVVAFTPESEPLKRGTVLEINMNELYVDSPQALSLNELQNMLFGGSKRVTTLSMLRALEVAAQDPNITAVSLKMDGVEQLSLTKAEELRGALERFREVSAKPIYAYAESYSQVEYYLSSVADRIFIHPLGQLEWQGVAMNMLFYGDLIRGLGAHVEVFRPEACRYKSAVEPFSRGSMSSESREQSQRLVDILWSGVVDEVAASRNLTVESLRDVASREIVVEAERAREIGMVDQVAYEDVYNSKLESDGVVVKGGKLRRVTFANYAATLSAENEMNSGGGDKIAIIYIDGTIVDGRSEPSGGYVGSQSVVEQIRRARESEDVRGVVLRVNSPGGSAMAADVMWREVELLKSEKAVVVSMGGYAASGGYYVSAPADAIVADRFTLTGSIGVYGMMVDYKETLSKNLGINIDGVGSEPSADFGRVPRGVTPLERAAMMRSVDQIYDSFTTKVSQGRNLPIGVVMALSGGQVWSGVEAESCGLVDGLGGLDMALSVIVDRCALEAGSYQVVEITPEGDELDILLSTLGMKLSSMANDGLFALLKKERSQITSDLRALESSNGVLMLTSEYLEF